MKIHLPPRLIKVFKLKALNTDIIFITPAIYESSYMSGYTHYTGNLMILLKKHIFTLIALCVASCISLAQAVTIEQMQNFLLQNSPEKYLSVFDSCEINPATYSEKTIEILLAIEKNEPLNEAGITPLDVAVQIQHGTWIEAVLNYSNSANIRSLRSFKQALEQAIVEGSTIPIKSPKWTSHIVNQPLNSTGNTAIILATQAGNQLLIDQLKEFGADPEKRNIAGNNAL